MKICNLSKVKNNIMAFHIFSGWRISIMSPDGNENLSCTPEMSSFCQILRSNPKADELCRKSDACAMQKARATNHSCIYTCPFGLYEAVIPIMVNSTVTGFIMVGQILLDSPSSISKSANLARPFFKENCSPEHYLESLPKVTCEKLFSSIPILESYACQFEYTNSIKEDNQTVPYKIRQYIMDNYTRDDLTIDELCKYLNYSRTYIMKTFKDEFGISIVKFTNNVRIQKAALLLNTTNMTIKQISDICGYNNVSYFCRVFKNILGYNPSQLRVESEKQASS